MGDFLAHILYSIRQNTMSVKNKKATAKPSKVNQKDNRNNTKKPPLGDALWLIGLAALICAVLSLLSFSMSDPAWSRSTAAIGEVQNIIGIFGAYLSDILYYSAGFSIWWLMLATVVWLVRYFPYRNRTSLENYHPVWSVVGLFLVLICSSIIEYALFHTTWKDTLPVGAGGLLGTMSTSFFRHLFGTSGSLILCFALLLLGLSLLMQLSWLILIEKMGQHLELLWIKLIHRPQKYVRNGIADRTTRRMVRKAENLTKQQESTHESARSGRKKSLPKTEKISVYSAEQQAILPFEEENHQPHASGSLKMKPYQLSTTLLNPPPQQRKAQISPEKLQENAERIESKLAEFGIEVKVVSATAGPIITRYEIEPAQGVKGSQVVNLNKDLARSLSLQSVRVVETIAGRNTMGIELPNDERENVLLSEVIGANVFQKSASKLTIALGKDIAGKPVVADLAKMPHLLVAGTTGSGKSVAVNAMIVSMLYKANPEEVRFLMIDPKMLELSVYQDIPHLLAPVITDMKQASQALNWCVAEMEKRYHLLAHTDVRSIAAFNEKIQAASSANKPIPNPFSLNPDDPEPLNTLPYIVVIIDELADLMMVEGKKVEQQIARLAQKARAAGIHLILATQRPSVDVITGLIKANIPTRISFQVSSRIDSRTILDQMGAEHLLGKGDMLFLPPGVGIPTRLHGAFLSDNEVLEITSALKRHAPAQYLDGILDGGTDHSTGYSGSQTAEDELFDQAVQFILETRKTSISALQRHLRIGYNRSANLMQAIEDAGIISAPETGGNRHILARNDKNNE